MKTDEQIRVIELLMQRLDEGVNVDAGVQLRNPTEVYRSPEIAAREWDAFFRHHPQVIGMSADLSAAGSFLTTNDFGVHAAPAGEGLPVMSLCHARYDPLEMTAILAGAGVHARAGFHCAPWIHEHLGTQVAGTLRLSPGPATTDAELDEAGALLAAL